MIAEYTVHQLLAEILEEIPGVEPVDFLRITDQEVGKLSVEYPWRWFQDVYRFSTVETYAEGTVSVTEGDATVTGSGTTFTSAMVGRKFKLDNSSVIYEIETYTDATHVELDRVVTDDTDSGLDYQIYQDTYSMPSDLWRMLQISDVETGRVLVERGPFPRSQYGVGLEYPQAYRQWGVDFTGNYEIVLDGVPTESRALELAYWRMPTASTAPSDTPDLPPHLHEALKLSVLLVYLRRSKDEAAMMRKQEIKMEIGNALRLAKKQDAQFTRPTFRNERTMF